MKTVRWRWVWIAVLAALLVRVPAATSLPMDADEPIYLEASTDYANAIRAGELSTLLVPSANAEHPSLVKILYGVGIAGLGPDPGLSARLAVVRSMSLAASVGAVGLAAAVHPAAGIAMATHTLHAKYTSQGYLEALPGLWMMVAMLAGWRTRGETVDGRWGIGSASAWGAAAAGKWLHALPGVVLVLALLRVRWQTAVVVLGTALASTWLLDPQLWLAPGKQLAAMLAHHQAYAATDAPLSDWWSPLWVLGAGEASSWHPEVFPISLDGLWLLLGLSGIGWTAARPGPQRSWARYLAAWFGVGAVFLALWPTRWPQHAMILVPPMCLGVGLAVDSLSRATRRFGPSGSHPPASG